MEHVVFYPAASGVPAFRRVSSLEEAVAFVEHMRNAENVTDFSVHELNPVQLSFRAYYHAELPIEARGASAPASDAPVTPSEPEAAPVTEPEPEPQPVAAVAEEPAIADALVAEVALLSVVPEAPVDEAPEPSEDGTAAETDDRSQEWIAEATVVEPPVDSPPVEAAEEPVAFVAPEIPGLAEEPVVSAVPPFAEPVAEPVAAEVAEAPAQRTPFADAPPVTAPAAESETPAEDAESAANNGDVIPALAPSGRRSLGFFAR